MVLIRNVTLVLPGALVENGWLRVGADGRIAEVGAAGPDAASSPSPPAPQPGESIVEGAGDFLAPGFIDGHVHGALGRDAMEADADGFATICGFHAAAGGTTALALASVAAPDDALRRLLVAAREFRAAQAPGEGARLLGIHVEGPYFAPTRAGAHRPEFLRAPDPREYGGWLDDFGDLITQLTLAPELPGALPLVAALAARGHRRQRRPQRGDRRRSGRGARGRAAARHPPFQCHVHGRPPAGKSVSRRRTHGMGARQSSRGALRDHRRRPARFADPPAARFPRQKGPTASA